VYVRFIGFRLKIGNTMPTYFSSARPSRLGLSTFSVICLLFCILLAGHAPALAQSAPQPVSLAVDSTRQTWLLWNNPDGSTALTNINPDGSLASTQPPSSGPIAGWNCTAVAAGPGTPRLLWQHAADGQASVWTLDASGAVTTSTPGYGPYSGWTAQGLSLNGDSQARLLFKHGPSDQFAVWTLAGSSYASSTPGYGPLSSGGLLWDAKAIAGGSDSLTRLLLVRGDGAAAVWTLDSSGYVGSSSAFAQPAGYSCRDVAVGGDNLTRLLWVNTSSGGAGVWTLTSGGVFGSSTPLLGPPAGYTAVGMAAGPDNVVRLLWSDGVGDAQVWTVAADGTYTSATYSTTPSLTAAATGANKVTLYWSGTSGASGYNVSRSTVSGGPYTQIATNVGTADTGPGMVNAFMYSDAAGLTPGTEYFYVISAVYSGTAGPQSNEDSAIPDASAVPWDTGDPVQILNAETTQLNAVLPPEIDPNSGDLIPTDVGLLTVQGPDSIIYEGPDADGNPATSYASPGYYNADSHQLVFNDGTTQPVSPQSTTQTLAVPNVVPNQNSLILFENPHTTQNLDFPYAPHLGIYRKVESKPGYVGLSMTELTFPSPGTSSGEVNLGQSGLPGQLAQSDSADIYTGGDVLGFGDGTLDAGLTLMTSNPVVDPAWGPIAYNYYDNPKHKRPPGLVIPARPITITAGGQTLSGNQRVLLCDNSYP